MLLFQPHAIVFVDYEQWCIPLHNTYTLSPEANAWYEHLSKQYHIDRFMVFGDFSDPFLEKQRMWLNGIPCEIVDTRSGTQNPKELTDFVMLDAIYRSIGWQNQNYILLTGDGHFTYVTKYLKEKKKHVLIYAVSGALSETLKDTADEVRLLPDKFDSTDQCSRFIIENFNYLFKYGGNKVYPSFNKTVEIVASKHSLPEQRVREAMQDLIDRRIVLRQIRKIEFNKEITFYHVDWQKAIEAGLWSADRA